MKIKKHIKNKKKDTRETLDLGDTLPWIVLAILSSVIVSAMNLLITSNGFTLPSAWFLIILGFVSLEATFVILLLRYKKWGYNSWISYVLSLKLISFTITLLFFGILEILGTVGTLISENWAAFGEGLFMTIGIIAGLIIFIGINISIAKNIHKMKNGECR